MASLYTLKTLRGLWRLLYFACFSSLKIFQIISLNLIKGTDIKRSMHLRRSWARHLLPAIGVRIHMEGKVPDYPCILMGNHRSYLDPAVLVHDVFAYAVSKAEVANWPIIGYGAKVTGTLFVQRERKLSRKIALDGIAEKVREGFAVILFPEGTTHSDASCHPFKPGGFKLAVREAIPIVPVAIEYQSKSDYWIGDDTFLPHFIKQFSKREINVFVRFGAPIKSNDSDYLKRTVAEWINEQLKTIQKSF